VLARQALFSALSGFALGLVPSFIARFFIQRTGLLVMLTPGLLVSVLLGTILMCLLAALVSFRKIASIDPALVFRS
jgi:putative ABC transport system permease protein